VDPRNEDPVERHLAFACRSQAVEEGLPFAYLLDEANLGSPVHAGRYATATYRCADGALYRGAPIAYAAAALRNSSHPRDAAAFLSFLGSELAAKACERHAFRLVS